MPAEPVLPFLHLITMPAYHTTVIYRQGGVGDHQSLVDAYYLTETLTLRTGACGRVKREHLVVWLLEGYTVCLKTGGEIIADVGWLEHHPQFTMSFIEGCLSRVYKTGNSILGVIDRETVNNKVDDIRIIGDICLSCIVCQVIVDALEGAACIYT